MNYNELIETVTEILNNDKIIKNGMTIVYSLKSENFEKLREELYYRSSNDRDKQTIEKDNDYEIEIDNLVLKFIKADN